MLKLVFLILIIILLILLFYVSNNKLKYFTEKYSGSHEKLSKIVYEPDNLNKNSKPKIWMYWETLPNNRKPGYIDLCYESVIFNCSSCFDIMMLDEKTIHNYLPGVKKINFS
jgi:hypothetical protein